jgi:hypothetical protein
LSRNVDGTPVTGFVPGTTGFSVAVAQSGLDTASSIDWIRSRRFLAW